MKLSMLDYKIIDSTKCGEEPLFILISIAQHLSVKDLKVLFRSLVKLVGAGLLRCNDVNSRQTKIVLRQLDQYVARRKKAGEVLSEPPNRWLEYSFEATPQGISFLRPKDRPLAIQNVKWIGHKAYSKSRES